MSTERVRVSDTNAAFAKWLRLTRKQSGLSQQQIANALTAEGLTLYQQTIAKIEQGKRSVQLDEAVALALLFGTRLDDALGMKFGPGSVAAEKAARRTALLSQMRDAIDAELGGVDS